jgi:hypothetical protein
MPCRLAACSGGDQNRDSIGIRDDDGAVLAGCNRSTFSKKASPCGVTDRAIDAFIRHGAANSCPNDVDESMEGILDSIEAIRNSPEKLRGCIAQSELPFSLR